MSLPPKLPEYKLHKSSGRAYVRIDGRFVYLGKYGSPESRSAFASVVADVLAERPVVAPRPRAGGAAPSMTVRQLSERYNDYADGYYRRDGIPTGEADTISAAWREVVALYGEMTAEAFGPLALDDVRKRMLDRGLARSTINGAIHRIRRGFRWGAERQLLPASAYEALRTLTALKAGRSSAREPKKVAPVADEVIDATVTRLSTLVGAMVRLQRLTAMRPGEVIRIRPCDVDRTGAVWLYRPMVHKTQHHGRERVVPLGPRAQEVLRPYLNRAAEAWCFSPSEAEDTRRSILHALRLTPLSCGNRPGSNRANEPKSSPGERYTTNTYAQAIRRACERAGVEHWSPNQLRHTAATAIRRELGLDAAQVVLGHASADVTQVYAEKNLAAGIEAARRLG
jgi:integrase